jgi:preprotein translocase SecF subunit
MNNPDHNGKYFHYVERAPIWLSISLFTIVAGIVAMIVNYSQTGSAFKLGLAFTGGQSLLLRFKDPMPVDGQAVKTIVDKYAEGDTVVQVYADEPHEVSIKLRVKTTGKDEQEHADQAAQRIVELKKELGNAFGGYSEGTGGTTEPAAASTTTNALGEPTGTTTPAPSNTSAQANPQTLEQAFVGPTVGKELIRNAIWALVLGSVLIMIYILIRFGSWPYSLAGILAMIHDVQITMTVVAVMRLEISEAFIAVFLTIVGYSINDTIIIFDRIRENLRLHGGRMDFKQLCNISLNQTVVRSINTVATVVIMIVAMLVVGGHNLRDFLIAMLAGMVSGAYSSIFVATPLMLWFSKGRAPQSPEAALVGGGTVTLPRTSVAVESEDGAGPDAAPRRTSSSAPRTAKKQRRR